MINDGVMINIDWDMFFWIYTGNNRNIDNPKKQLSDYVKTYSGHHVTDLIFNVFGQSSLTPSEKWTFMGDKYDWKTENGIKVDYTKSDDVVAVKTLYQFGFDPIEYMIDETKKYGMNPWISFRMNDAHFHASPTLSHRGMEFYQLKKINGFSNSWFNGQFDFEDQTVRDKMLNYLTEQIDRYDVYGFELDFQREIFCFAYWEKDKEYYCEIINEFIRKIKKVIERKEKRVNHKIKLMVRLTRDIEQNKIFGFDAKTWVDEGLVDILVPSPRYASTDGEMPIDEWKNLVKGSKTQIVPCIENFLSREFSPIIGNTVESVKGFASSYFNQGADKIYLFNYFWNYSLDSDLACENRASFWDIVSNEEQANQGTRRNVLTYQESDIVPKGCKQFKPLPKEMNDGDYLKIKLGKIKASQKITVYLVVDNNQNLKGVLFNGVALSPSNDSDSLLKERRDLDGTLKPFSGEIIGNQVISFAGDRINAQGECEIKLNLKVKTTVFYLEVKIEE